MPLTCHTYSEAFIAKPTDKALPSLPKTPPRDKNYTGEKKGALLFRVRSLYECGVEVIITREPSMSDACIAR